MGSRLIRRNRPVCLRPRLESLEERVVPTANLFLDFGENFPASGLVVTPTELSTLVTKGGLGGPTTIKGADLNITSLSSVIVGKIDHNDDGILDEQDYLDYRDDVLALVQRYYEPFNVNVQLVNNSSVATINSAMQANDNLGVNAGIYDAYVILGQVRQDNSPVGAKHEYYRVGVDPGYDHFANISSVQNVQDNTALMFGDRLLQQGSTRQQRALFGAYMVAQAAAQSYASTISEGYLWWFMTQDAIALSKNDLMRAFQPINLAYGSLLTGNEGTEPSMFTRFPLVDGNWNTVSYDTPVNVFESLAEFSRSNLGMKSDPTLVGADLPNTGEIGPAYVTGTGAHDLITITRLTDTTASVSVTAYRNPNFTGVIDIPGVAANSFTYTINTEGGLIIDTGGGNDRVQIDARIGGTIKVRGMSGTDQLIIEGKNAKTAVFTPAGTTKIGLDGKIDLRGTITVDNTTVVFEEFKNTSLITINNVADFTFRSPGGADNLELVNAGNLLRVRGKINGNSDFAPFTVSGVQTFTIDVANGEPIEGADNVVTLRNALTAPGLQNVRILFGAGNDRLVFQQGNLALPVAGGGFFIDGGAGDDVVEFFAGEVNLEPGQFFTFLGGEGNDSIQFNDAFLNVPTTSKFIFDGGAGDDSITLSSASIGRFEFHGGEGNDRLVINSASVNNFTFDGGAGDDELLLIGDLNILPGGKFTFEGGEGNDLLEVAGAVTFGKNGKFIYDGGAGTNTIASGGSAPHTWTVGNNTITLDSKLTFTNVQNVRGGSGVDVFVFLPNSAFDGTLDGGGGGDVLNLVQLRNVLVSLIPSNVQGTFDIMTNAGGQLLPVVRNISQVWAGNGLADTLRGLDSNSRWLLSMSGSRYVTGKFQLRFRGFERLLSGAGNDELVIDAAMRGLNGVMRPGTPINNPGGAQLFFDGGGGLDQVRIHGSPLADVFNVLFDAVIVQNRILRLANVQSLQIFGGAGNDSFTLSSLAYLFNTIDLYGDGGADTFTITPSTTTGIRVFGDGLNNLPTPGDVLRVMRGGIELAGARPTPGAKSGQFNFTGGRLPLLFFGIDRLTGNGGQFLPFI